MTNLDTVAREDIDKLLNRWNIVQGRLKRAEQISQIAVIPAINELRYAGRMLVGALADIEPSSDNGIPSLDKAITTANQYITNAEHDISDALIYFYQKKADDLNSRFGADTIRKAFPEYGDLLELLKKSRKLVISSREKMKSRQSNYKDLVGLTDQLTEKYFLFVDADILFGLEVDHYRAKILLWKTLCIGGIAASIVLSAAYFSFF